eukprot:GHVT01023662.1.p1 GENE.GHVT01023662.1~~GHVT01023662.1.p1  ORF type:complete len:183 (+),score=4.94 GHVT01023662.1:185-733(+)
MPVLKNVAFAVSGNTTLKFIDTAGIRRINRVRAAQNEEYYTVNRAMKAVSRADVCLLVLDSARGVSEQDIRLAQTIADEGRACVVLCNKWDAIEKNEHLYSTVVGCVRRLLSPVRWAEVIPVSAKSGIRLVDVIKAAERASIQHRRRVSTASLNEIVHEAISLRPPQQYLGLVPTSNISSFL